MRIGTLGRRSNGTAGLATLQVIGREKRESRGEVLVSSMVGRVTLSQPPRRSGRPSRCQSQTPRDSPCRCLRWRHSFQPHFHCRTCRSEKRSGERKKENHAGVRCSCMVGNVYHVQASVNNTKDSCPLPNAARLTLPLAFSTSPLPPLSSLAPLPDLPA